MEDFMIFELDDEKIKVPIEIDSADPETKGGEPRWIIPQYWKDSNELLIDYGDGKGYIKVMGKAKPLGSWRRRPYPIEVNEVPTVKELKGKGIIKEGWEIAPKSKPKERFIDVIMAFYDIFTQSGKMEGMKKYDNFANKKLGSRSQQNKFIKFGHTIGLFTAKGGQRQARKIQTKLEADVLAFSEQPAIENWQKFSKMSTDKDRQTLLELKKALHILDLSPAQFLKGDEKDPRMKDPNLRMHAFEAWLDDLRETPTFHGRRSEHGEDDPHIWSLDEWAMAQKRPFWSGDGMEYTKAGVRIAQKKRAGSLASRGSQKRNFIEALKHFAVVSGVMIGGKKGTESKWSLPSPTLHYNTLSMDAGEMIKMEECLRNPPEPISVDGNPIIRFSEKSVNLKYPDTIKEGDEVIPHPFAGEKMDVEYDTTKADWDDTLLYYLIALEVGWRANEGLTATANILDTAEEPAYSTGIYFQEKGSEEVPEGFMFLKFLTRKSWKHRDKKGVLRTTHSELILTEDTRRLVQEKVNKIEAGTKLIGKISDKELFDTYGIERWTKNAEGEIIKNKHHALIGHDGKYIDSATMKFPTKHKLSPRKLMDLEEAGALVPELKEKDASKKLHAILRKCFIDSGVNLDEVVDGKPIGQYWLTDTSHALRHVFAQKWLMQSNWNYSHVAVKGHWASTKILEEAYGGKPEKTYLQDSVQFSLVKLKDVEKKDRQEYSEGMLAWSKRQKDQQTDKDV